MRVNEKRGCRGNCGGDSEKVWKIRGREVRENYRRASRQIRETDERESRKNDWRRSKENEEK